MPSIHRIQTIVYFILSTWTTTIFYADINLPGLDNTTDCVENDFLNVLNVRKKAHPNSHFLS